MFAKQDRGSPRAWHGPQSSGHVPQFSPSNADGLSHTRFPHVFAGGRPLLGDGLGLGCDVRDAVADADVVAVADAAALVLDDVDRVPDSDADAVPNGSGEEDAEAATPEQAPYAGWHPAVQYSAEFPHHPNLGKQK